MDTKRRRRQNQAEAVATTTAAAGVSALPKALIQHMLTWLSVTEAGRLRCVQRQWRQVDWCAGTPWSTLRLPAAIRHDRGALAAVTADPGARQAVRTLMLVDWLTTSDQSYPPSRACDRLAAVLPHLSTLCLQGEPKPLPPSGSPFLNGPWSIHGHMPQQLLPLVPLLMLPTVTALDLGTSTADDLAAALGVAYNQRQRPLELAVLVARGATLEVDTLDLVFGERYLVAERLRELRVQIGMGERRMDGQPCDFLRRLTALETVELHLARFQMHVSSVERLLTVNLPNRARMTEIRLRTYPANLQTTTSICIRSEALVGLDAIEALDICECVPFDGSALFAAAPPRLRVLRLCVTQASLAALRTRLRITPGWCPRLEACDLRVFDEYTMAYPEPWNATAAELSLSTAIQVVQQHPALRPLPLWLEDAKAPPMTTHSRARSDADRKQRT